tara:strand:+ start:1447 stop:2343 length:897 start_codon:yes stop_codon:yes gene_type:complete
VNLNLLSKKFPEEDIEWRIQMCGNNSWALVVPYITNRAIMQRLDDAVGPGKWKNEFIASPCNTGYQCGISIKIDDEWVCRWDGSEAVGSNTIDKVKSTMSSAMKRTGVQWGIGRYLYQLEAGFADVQPCAARRDLKPGYIFHENKNKKEIFQWKPPALEAWALPLNKKDITRFMNVLGEVDTFEQLRFAWIEIYKAATSENDEDVMKRFTEAKDKAKIRIENQAIFSEKEDTIKITTWLTKQLTAFDLVGNVAAVTSLKDSLVKQLDQKAKNTVVNLEPLKEQLEESFNNRINKLESK